MWYWSPCHVLPSLPPSLSLSLCLSVFSLFLSTSLPVPTSFPVSPPLALSLSYCLCLFLPRSPSPPVALSPLAASPSSCPSLPVSFSGFNCLSRCLSPCLSVCPSVCLSLSGCLSPTVSDEPGGLCVSSCGWAGSSRCSNVSRPLWRHISQNDLQTFLVSDKVSGFELWKEGIMPQSSSIMLSKIVALSVRMKLHENTDIFIKGLSRNGEWSMDCLTTARRKSDSSEGPGRVELFKEVGKQSCGPREAFHRAPVPARPLATAGYHDN